MFLDVFWTLRDAAKVFGTNVYGQELQWLFAKYTCCMLRILQVNLGRLWCNFVFLDVHDVFWQLVWLVFNNKLKPIFSAKLHLRFLEAACRFTTTSWTRRMFLEFMRSLRWFWNVWGEFSTCEFTPMKMDNSLNVNGWEFIFRFPLPLPRRQSWNKNDTTQCMVHDRQPRYFALFPVWKRVERLVQWEPLFLGFCVLF